MDKCKLEIKEKKENNVDRKTWQCKKYVLL